MSSSSIHNVLKLNNGIISGISDGLSFVKMVDCKVTKTLTNTDIIARPSKSSGIWCGFLIPLILIINTVIYNVSAVYKFTSFLSFAILLNYTIFIYFITLQHSVWQQPEYGGCLPCGLIATLLTYTILDQSLILSLTLTLPVTFLHNYLIWFCLKKIPKTFTVGETSIVVQGSILFLFMTISRFFIIDESLDLVNTVIYAALSSFAIILAVFFYLREDISNNTPEDLIYFTLSVLTAMFIFLHVLLGPGFVWQLVEFIFYGNRPKILLSWVALLSTAILAIYLKTKSKEKADTMTRKSFHLLAGFVFGIGIIYDVELIKFAAGVGFGLILFVEGVRKLGIEPYSSILMSAFEIYSDEKDAGVFAVTPIYLFVGLACPLLLVPPHEGHELELLSGVMSIGIGDTAASCVGSLYGSNMWPNSSKTVEGTLANIISQIIFVLVLNCCGILNVPRSLCRTLLAAIISGLVEAKTDQVDNLVLPLVTLLMFQVTSCFCL